MKIGMIIGIFVGNLMARKFLFNASWTESFIVATLATIILAICIYFFYPQ